MNNKEKKNLMNKIWIITDVIIVICAILLFIEGGTFDIILGIMGIVLVIVEYFLYKKGYILQ